MTELPDAEQINRSPAVQLKANILLVDDNSANLLSLRVVLDELGENLVEAISGEEALNRARTDEFAVVLLNVVMPGINGFETAKLIRQQERSRHTPIIFLTAQGLDHETLERGYTLAPVDFLIKPVLPVILQGKVRGFVELFREKQLAKREAEQLRLLVEGAQDYAIFLLDTEGRVVSWNAGAERIKGYRADEIIGQHFSRFYPQEAIDRGWPEHEIRMAETDGRFEDEGWRIRKDGSQFWANVVITALRDEAGNLRGFSKITRDMTERKKSEENARRLIEETTARRVAEENARQIQEQRERLHVTLASIGDAVISTDAAGRVTFLNPVAQELVGWDTGEAVGRPLPEVFQIVNEDTHQPVENPALRALREGQIVGLANHTILISKAGRKRPIDDSGAPIRDADGNVIGSILVFRDISEQKRGDARLRTSEARKSAILEMALDCIITIDHLGKVIEFNPAAERTFGFTREQVIGQELCNFIIPPALRQQHRDGMARYLLTGEGPVLGKRLELPAQRADGSEFPAELSIIRISTTGEPMFTAYLRDISEQKQIERYRNLRLAVTHAVAEATSIESGAKAVLEAVCDNLTWDVGFFWAVNERGDALICLESWHAPGTDSTRFEIASRDCTFARGAGLPGRVWATGKAAYILDVTHDQNFARAATAAQEGLHSAISCPLIVGERTVGVIEFLTRRLRGMDAGLLEIMETVAGHFGQFIERQAAEDRLRQSEQQLSDFFENATIGLHWVGPDGIIIRANKTELEMLGYSRDEYVGHPIGKFHADHDVICDILKRLEAGENLREYPARLKCKNGSIKEVVIDSSVMWKDGEFVHTRCFTRDVTERNRAEAARIDAERRLNAVFNQQFQFMVILAADGTVIDANEMCFTATNTARKDIIGHVFWEVPWWNGLPDMQMTWRMLVVEALHGASPRTAEVQYVGSDGTIRLATTIVSGLKNDNGKVVNVVIEGRDDTTRKRQETELRESEEKLRLLADTIPQLAWMAQPDGYISWYNRRWYEYTGTSREDMEGWGWQSVHDLEVLPTVLERWRASLTTGEPFDMIYPLRGKDGEFRPFLTRVNPLRDPQGRIIYWFGTSTDISDIKRMEEALRDADRRKDEFLATLAHELRNPLAPIRNSLQILKMPRVDAEMIQQTRDIMERQVHHLVRLVDDLLDVSRVMRGKIELRREPVELATVIARAVETANPLIDVQGHQLEISVSTESLLMNVDPVRLTQVIGNLLTNSAKYTDANGHIWLSARKEGESAILSVRDDGIGISPELLPHVFELFVQADHTSTKAQGGLGIGLTLVKNLVLMHGGSVKAISAGIGKGSEFVVQLPLIPRETSTAGNTESELHNPESTVSGRRILVVDDNRDAAISLSLLLRLQGHDVRVAHDGQSALNLAATHRPEVVFLDLGMPQMDGFAVAERIRKLPQLEQVVLVALTGWGQQQDRQRTSEAGFNYHLVKPPEPTAIEALLAEVQRSDSNNHL